MLYVGLDFGQDEIHLATCTANSKPRYLRKFENRYEQFPTLIGAIKKRCKHYGHSHFWLVLEPTGGYELDFATWAYNQGYKVALPNPADIRSWAKSANYRSKTDTNDAKMLAHYASSAELKLWRPMPKEYRELASLLTWRKALHTDLRRAHNQLHSLMAKGEGNSAVAHAVRKKIAWLEEEYEANEARITHFLKEHPDINAKAKLLRKNPGVGEKLVLPLLVLCQRWYTLTDGQGSSKALTAFVGLDPVHYRSGTSVYKRSTISKKGSKYYRALLYAGARGGITAKSGPLKEFYNRLKGKGKATRLCLIAVARKILVWAWAVFRTNSEFDPAKASSRNSHSLQPEASAPTHREPGEQTAETKQHHEQSLVASESTSLQHSSTPGLRAVVRLYDHLAVSSEPID